MSGEIEAVYYDSLLKLAQLDPLAADYHKNVLSLLKSDFSITLAAYTDWSEDSRLISYYSMGFPADFIRQAHAIYINDVISDLVHEQASSNTWNGAFFSQDADPFTFSGSNIIAHLNSSHISYFALLVLSRRPRQNIVICKTDKEGPFTPMEKAIMQRICAVLTRHAETRLTYSRSLQVLDIVNAHCTGKSTGLIITDVDQNILTYNEAALSLIPRRLNLTHISAVSAFVFSLFEDESRSEEDWDISEHSLSRYGRLFTLEELELSDEEGRRTVYYLITIAKNRHYENTLDRKAAAQYGLTEREIHTAELLVAGYSNTEIADQLHITIHTVKIHVSNLFRKLNVHTRVEAILKLTGSTH